MPISGLVLTLINPHDAERLARDLHQREPRLDFGELQGHHLPAVLETGTAHESRDVHDWLCRQPGIASVDVTFVSVEEANSEKEGFIP